MGDTGVIGEDKTIETSHIEPLVDEHSKHLKNTISTAGESTTGQTKTFAEQATSMATQAKDTVVNAAQQAMDAIAGKK